MFSRFLRPVCVFASVLVACTAGSVSIVKAQSGTADIRVDSLTLDKTRVVLPCRPGTKAQGEGCNDSRTIRAKATISGGGVKGSRLEAVVSGGRATKVSDLEFDWDLASEMPGTYTLTVAAVDKDGRYGGSKTVSVNVERCVYCEHFDVCPTISIYGPLSPVEEGHDMTFTASVTGGSPDAYNWTVSAGTIVSGQGTPTIVVQTGPAMSGMSVTATLEVANADWMIECTRTASETGFVVGNHSARLVDEFRTAGSNCEEGFARLDAFLIELQNNPNDQGVIILYSETAAPRSGRIRKQQLVFYIKSRKFDQTRVTFIDGSLMKDAMTQFWMVPPGAESPVPVAGEGAVPAVVVPAATKPYLFAAEYSDGIAGCSGPFDIAAYASVLNTEPKSRGRIVIAETSTAKYNQKRREILAELKANGVSATRVNTVYKRVARMQALESTELWVIPPSKK